MLNKNNSQYKFLSFPLDQYEAAKYYNVMGAISMIGANSVQKINYLTYYAILRTIGINFFVQ